MIVPSVGLPGIPGALRAACSASLSPEPAVPLPDEEYLFPLDAVNSGPKFPGYIPGLSCRDTYTGILKLISSIREVVREESVDTVSKKIYFVDVDETVTTRSLSHKEGVICYNRFLDWLDLMEQTGACTPEQREDLVRWAGHFFTAHVVEGGQKGTASVIQFLRAHSKKFFYLTARSEKYRELTIRELALADQNASHDPSRVLFTDGGPKYDRLYKVLTEESKKYLGGFFPEGTQVVVVDDMGVNIDAIMSKASFLHAMFAVELVCYHYKHVSPPMPYLNGADLDEFLRRAASYTT